MKHLIPLGFMATGAYLLGLPIYSQMAAYKLMVTAPAVNFSGPTMPFLHLLLLWLIGLLCFFFSVFFGIKSYKQE